MIDTDVDGAFGEAGFAVAEVVDPFAAELLVERSVVKRLTMGKKLNDYLAGRLRRL